LVIQRLKNKVADLEKRVEDVEKRPPVTRYFGGGGVSKRGAVAAVEAEPTLDLTGILTVDHINEYTTDHGIEIESMKIKDGGVDGDSLIFAGNRGANAMELTYQYANRARLLKKGTTTTIELVVKSIIPMTDIAMGNTSSIRSSAVAGHWFTISSYLGAAQVDCVKFINGYMDIMKAGDIHLLANKTFDGAGSSSFFDMRACHMALSTTTPTPVAGSCYYNVALDQILVYDGVAWNVH